jgi:hypothetical protein
MPGRFENGFVFPGTFEPDPRRSQSFTLSPGASFSSLRAVPRQVPSGPGVGIDKTGSDAPVDLSDVPMPANQFEAMVQVCQ